MKQEILRNIVEHKQYKGKECVICGQKKQNRYGKAAL